MALRYDASIHRYRNAKTGRLTGFNTVASIVESEAVSAENKMAGLARKLIRGNLTVEEFQSQGAVIIRDTSVRMGLVAAGGRWEVTQQDYGLIGSELRSQYQFLADFGSEIERGEVSPKQIINRAKQYGRNTRGTFYRVEFQRRARTGYEAKRLLDAQSRHCASCIRHQQLFWTSVLNIVPIGIDCECRSRCKCRIVYRKSSQR